MVSLDQAECPKQMPGSTANVQADLQDALHRSHQAERNLVLLKKGIRLLASQMITTAKSSDDSGDLMATKQTFHSADSATSNSTDSDELQSSDNESLTPPRRMSCSSFSSFSSSRIHFASTETLTELLDHPIIGADLMALQNAASMVHEHSNLAFQEADEMVQDTSQAHIDCAYWKDRAIAAEESCEAMHKENSALLQRDKKLELEKRILVKEVKSLRKELAITQKNSWHSQLEHYIAGALTVHERQLKTATKSTSKHSLHATLDSEDDDDIVILQKEEADDKENNTTNNLSKSSKNSDNVVVTATISQDKSNDTDKDNPVATNTPAPASSTTFKVNAEQNSSFDSSASLEPCKNKTESLATTNEKNASNKEKEKFKNSSKNDTNELKDGDKKNGASNTGEKMNSKIKKGLYFPIKIEERRMAPTNIVSQMDDSVRGTDDPSATAGEGSGAQAKKSIGFFANSRKKKCGSSSVNKQAEARRSPLLRLLDGPCSEISEDRTTSTMSGPLVGKNKLALLKMGTLPRRVVDSAPLTPPPQNVTFRIGGGETDKSNLVDSPSSVLSQMTPTNNENEDFISIDSNSPQILRSLAFPPVGLMRKKVQGRT